jgi:predicted aldo/keto reductase-like oxidoreductase
MASDFDPIDRREFLRRGALTGIGLGLYPLAAGAGDDAPAVGRKVRLGRTGLEVSDIGFGASRLRGEERLVHHALERGVNYFDSAEGYTNGMSEQTLGRALGGKRDSVFLTSKVKCGARDTRDELMTALEGSLRRLRTDRVDIYFNHAVNSVDRLQNSEWSEFTSRAKQQGKLRFTGMSGHGGRLVECLDYAIDEDLFDVVLVAYNFGQDPAFVQRFTAAFDFVVAMKTLMGARLNDMRPYEKGEATFAQAAFRWVLSGPHVDSLIVSMKSQQMIDEYLVASGWRGVKPDDVSLLRRYDEKNTASQCRYGCGACEQACPNAVPIAEVLRARMYARDYGDLELARGDYATLGAGASACLGCAEKTCAGACPFGLAIPELTAATHHWLGYLDPGAKFPGFQDGAAPRCRENIGRI